MSCHMNVTQQWNNHLDFVVCSWMTILAWWWVDGTLHKYKHATEIFVTDHDRPVSMLRWDIPLFNLTVQNHFLLMNSAHRHTFVRLCVSGRSILSWQHFDCVVQTRTENCIKVYNYSPCWGHSLPATLWLCGANTTWELHQGVQFTHHVGVILSWRHFDCVVQTRPESCIKVYSLLTILESFCPGNTLIVQCKHDLRVASWCTV